MPLWSARRNLSRLRREQEEGEDHDDDALAETEIEEGGLEAGILDHRLDRRDCQRRACAKSGCGDACCEAALVGKPFQRVADAGAVDAAGADACDDHAEVVAVERGGLGVDRPSDGAKNAADENDEAGAVFVDEPAFDRHQPGFEQHEERERPLDRGAIPAEFFLDVGDEECPAILVVGDHHHCGDTDRELRPAKGVADTGRCRGRCLYHIRHSSSRSAPLLCFMTNARRHIGIRYARLQACDARPCANAAEWSATSETAQPLRLVQCIKNGPEKSRPLVESTISAGVLRRGRAFMRAESAGNQSPKRATSPLRTAIAALFISNRSIDGQEAAEQGAGGIERDRSSLGHLVPFSRLRRNSASSI